MFETTPDLQPEPPYCCDCAHLVGRRTYHEKAETWKCAAKENITSITVDLVTGFNVYHYLFESCYEARLPLALVSTRGVGKLKEEGCGPEGRWFLKYEHVEHNPSGLNLGGRRRPQADAEDLLKELEKT